MPPEARTLRPSERNGGSLVFKAFKDRANRNIRLGHHESRVPVHKCGQSVHTPQVVLTPFALSASSPPAPLRRRYSNGGWARDRPPGDLPPAPCPPSVRSSAVRWLRQNSGCKRSTDSVPTLRTERAGLSQRAGEHYNLKPSTSQVSLLLLSPSPSYRVRLKDGPQVW